jgi:hypothetical protein
MSYGLRFEHHREFSIGKQRRIGGRRSEPGSQIRRGVCPESRFSVFDQRHRRILVYCAPRSRLSHAERLTSNDGVGLRIIDSVEVAEQFQC